METLKNEFKSNLTWCFDGWPNTLPTVCAAHTSSIILGLDLLGFLHAFWLNNQVEDIHYATQQKNQDHLATCQLLENEGAAHSRLRSIEGGREEVWRQATA
jgi:hypothetical protein